MTFVRGYWGKLLWNCRLGEGRWGDGELGEMGELGKLLAKRNEVREQENAFKTGKLLIFVKWSEGSYPLLS